MELQGGPPGTSDSCSSLDSDSELGPSEPESSSLLGGKCLKFSMISRRRFFDLLLGGILSARSEWGTDSEAATRGTET